VKTKKFDFKCFFKLKFKIISSAKDFKDKKNYILIQQVERRWSNCNPNPTNYKNDDSEASILSRRPGSNKARLSYQYNRASSLSTFHNSSILNYTKAAASSSANESKKNSIELSSKKQSTSPKNIKILQNHEKIMEVQNKWTGNGKFILMEKSNFLVNIYFGFKIKLNYKSI
jgi:hypothetical protein